MEAGEGREGVAAVEPLIVVRARERRWFSQVALEPHYSCQALGR